MQWKQNGTSNKYSNNLKERIGVTGLKIQLMYRNGRKHINQQLVRFQKEKN